RLGRIEVNEVRIARRHRPHVGDRGRLVDEEPGRLLDEERVQDAATLRCRTLRLHGGGRRDGESENGKQAQEGASGHGVLGPGGGVMCMEVSPYYNRSSG